MQECCHSIMLSCRPSRLRPSRGITLLRRHQLLDRSGIVLESLCECTAAAHLSETAWCSSQDLPSRRPTRWRIRASHPSNQALTRNHPWFGCKSIPAESGIRGVMEHHIGAISGCSDLHEGKIRVMPDILQHVLEAAVFSRVSIGHAPW